ncbi:MAG: VWA domain-containing protein [Myxococcota bacterium]|nr:VWA domain-containing protein [Myxococcota bacterium]
MNTRDNRIYVGPCLVMAAVVFLASACSGEIDLAAGGTDEGTDTFPDDQDTDFEACAEGNYEIGLMPLDMLLALDTSYSMDFAPVGAPSSKWFAVKEAIKSFSACQNCNGLGIGVQYFPLRKLCSVADYGLPAVEFLELPDLAGVTAASLDEQRMAGGTPMVPLMQGALDYTRAYATANPERRVVIVLATDGIPDDTCQVGGEGMLPNTIDNVIELAGQGARSVPSVPTFVIGVGSELGPLNDISQAGNGGEAILVDVNSGNVEQAFLEALEDIRLASACEYDVEKLASEVSGPGIDFDKVNVLFTVGSKTYTFKYVGDEAGCAKAPTAGWYYDDPALPTKILLCPKTCHRVQNNTGGQVKILLGCEPIIPM